jgi:peptide/nickel transport system substrate-binding protein
MYKIVSLATGLLLLLVFITGCANSNGRNNTVDGIEAIDELVLAIGSEPEAGFDPTKGWGRYGSPLFQSTLLKRDDHLDIVNDLAAGYAVSDDRLTWTVTLREDVVFSDGVALTAEDVEYTFKMLQESGSAVDLTNLDLVEAEGNNIIFKLKSPQSTFVYHLITTGIVPKHAHGEGYAEHPIGSGPYRFVQWDRGQQLIVEANPMYYGSKPYFQKLTLLFLNEDTAFAAAKRGDVHLASIPAAFSKETVRGMRLEAVASVDNRGIAFPYQPSGTVTEEGYPIGNDVTADLAIRKAINMAIDRGDLVEGILEGYGTPAYTPVDNLPWWNSDTVFADGDITGAKSILADGGWQDIDGNGIVEKGALKAEFTLIYPSSDMIRQSLALAAADMVKAIGIQINVEGKSWAEIEKRMHADAIMLGWGSHDPLEMYNLYSSSYAGIDYYNTGYYGNSIVDRYYEQALTAESEEAALTYWKKSQWDGETGSSALGDAPWAWLVNLDHLYLVDEDLDIGGWRIQPHGHGWPITDNITDWRWKE